MLSLHAAAHLDVITAVREVGVFDGGVAGVRGTPGLSRIVSMAVSWIEREQRPDDCV